MAVPRYRQQALQAAPGPKWVRPTGDALKPRGPNEYAAKRTILIPLHISDLLLQYRATCGISTA